MHTSMMRPSSAAISLARLHVMRATKGERPSIPLLLAHSKSVSLETTRRCVEVIARKKSTMPLVDTPSAGSGRPLIDPNVVIGSLSFVVACLGLYLAISNDFERKLDSKLGSKMNGLRSEIKGMSTMLESKLDGQDRKIEGFGEKIVLQDLKYESKKYSSWFGLSATPVESEDRNVNDVVSKVSKNLDAKVNAAVAGKLEAVVKELRAETRDQMRVNDGTGSKN